MESITIIWMVFLLALVFAILLTPFSMHLARKLGAVDTPNERSVHAQATPRLGGVGIGISLVVTISFYISLDAFNSGFLVGLLIIFLTGLLDDVKSISHRLKFFGEILAVVAFIGISGSELTGVGDLFGFGAIHFGPLSFVVTIVCMVGLINAMNLSDGLDGLAGGLAVIASLFFALLAYKTGQQSALLISLAMAGSLIGFLMYNSFPARLFMGDVGSLMIGYTCAVLAVQLTQAGDGSAVQPITIALILAVPLLDTLIVMGKRIRQGSSPFLPDNTHMHHRLLGLGLSQNQSVSVLYALMFLYGFIALSGWSLEAYWKFYGALLLTGLIYRSVSMLRDNPWRLVMVMFAWGASLERLEKQQHERLAGLWIHFSRVLPNLILALFLLPIAFLDGALGREIWLLPLACIALLYLFRNHNVRIVGLLHGLLYLIILTLFFVYQTSLPSLWWHSYYWPVLLCISMLWIVLSLFIGHMRRLLSLHSFEVLLIMISWLGVFVLMPMLNASSSDVHGLRMICVYAIPMLLMAKLALMPRRQEAVS
ncbi:MAG: MraY family glycosyltransferase [Mariprofundus sp.]|nr:MraY family glycosyltransferase [Mariprofundus sp.]